MKKDTKNKKEQKKDHAWRKVPPKQEEPLPKNVVNKEWMWHKQHMAYTVHKLEDCQLCKQQADLTPLQMLCLKTLLKESQTNISKLFLHTLLHKTMNEGAYQHGPSQSSTSS